MGQEEHHNENTQGARPSWLPEGGVSESKSLIRKIIDKKVFWYFG